MGRREHARRARQRRLTHAARKAGVAASRPVFETWRERRDRERAERAQRPPRHDPFFMGAAAAAFAAPATLGLIDRLFAPRSEEVEIIIEPRLRATSETTS